VELSREYEVVSGKDEKDKLYSGDTGGFITPCNIGSITLTPLA
jgi:hypothetical protein